jgi:multicomponent Na+:H+ antiporter subunit A
MWVSGSILLGFLAALLAPALYRAAPGAARRLLPLVPLGLTVHFCTFLPGVVGGRTVVASLPWAAPLGLSLSWRLDGLSLLLALLISGVGALVVLYAGSYLEGHPHAGRFHGLLFLFMASMLGVVLADNVLALFVFWELTSLSSYFLIGFHHEREAARAAALQALLVTSAGGLALLAGSLLLAGAAGTFQLSEMGGPRDVREHAHYAPLALLLLFAAFTKSAQLPFHFWLPGAMEAPAPVSAYLHAATMVKAGVYLLARLHPVLSGPPLWQQTLVWAGAGTALLGGALALGERHFKRVLAYSTVSALGTMVFLLGIGTGPALQAMAALLVAHGLYKGALFLVAGAVEHAVHEPDVERLGRLRKALPFTAAAAGLASLSMGGVPPLFGFIAKELLYAAPADGAHARALTAGAFTVGALFLAVAVNAGIRPFWARRSEVTLPAGEVERPLWAAPLVLASLGLALGLWPGAASGLVGAATRAMSPEAEPGPLTLWHGVSGPLLLSVLTLPAGLALYLGRSALRRAARPLAALARFGPARGYGLALSGLRSIASLQTRLLQRGSLRGYLVITLGAAFALLGYTLVVRHGLPSPPDLRDLRFYEPVIAGLILVAALSAIRARSRFAAIISLGVVGYGVALIFILFGAPDLGITQLAVETLTVILLVLAFHHLPRFTALSSTGTRIRDAFIATGFGALMTALVLAAAETPIVKRASTYYGDVSLPLAHGHNVVNAILTDFRALDTLGEITVLATAALGVFALLKLRPQESSAR